jgi:hypothetical protein
MKKLLLLLALFWAFSANATITRVQSNSALGTANTSISASFTTATTAGNWYGVLCRSGNQAGWTLSVSDTEGNTWLSLTAAVSAGSHMSQIFYVENVKGGTTDTVTCTQSSGVSGTMAILILEYSGIATSGSLDQQNQTAGTNNTATLTGASITTTNANDLVIGGAGLGANTTFTAGTGYTLDVSDARLGWETQIVSSTGTFTPTMNSTTTASSWTFTTAAFKAAGAPPAGAPHQLTTLGVGMAMISSPGLPFSLGYQARFSIPVDLSVLSTYPQCMETCTPGIRLCDASGDCLDLYAGDSSLDFSLLAKTADGVKAYPLGKATLTLPSSIGMVP